MREYFIGGSRDKVYIITELMRGGELLEALLERGSYSETDARTIFKQILSGVAYLHSKHITHRDLKLENLLLADKGDLSSVRIADFGLAKAAFGGDPNGDPNASPFAMDVMCGTLAYVAPEVLGRRRYTPAVDLWSCGVILYILLSGVVPFDDPDERRLMTKIMRGAYSLTGSEWACISVEAKALVSGLMCLEVSQRLSAAQALGHAWFQRGAEADAMRNASVRLVAFAARSKPPVRTFLPGSFLVTTGDRATEVFLIRTGACEVLVEEPSGSTGQLGEEEEGARFQVLGTRGVGEFVGEQGVITNERGELTLGGATVGASAAEDAGRQASPRTQADALWSSPLVAHKFARKWVGKRRTCSVRALTEVTALVLQRREMAWALENDVRQPAGPAHRVRPSPLTRPSPLSPVHAAGGAYRFGPQPQAHAPQMTCSHISTMQTGLPGGASPRSIAGLSQDRQKIRIYYDDSPFSPLALLSVLPAGHPSICAPFAGCPRGAWSARRRTGRTTCLRRASCRAPAEAQAQGQRLRLRRWLPGARSGRTVAQPRLQRRSDQGQPRAPSGRARATPARLGHATRSSRAAPPFAPPSCAACAPAGTPARCPTAPPPAATGPQAPARAQQTAPSCTPAGRAAPLR